MGRLPCIGSTVFNSIFSRCPDFVDGVSIRPTELDLAFSSSNSIKPMWSYCPERVLVRFKFLEAVVRLALDKYFKTKIVDSCEKALERAF